MSDLDKCEVCGTLTRSGKKYFMYYAKILRVNDSKAGKEIYKTKIILQSLTSVTTVTNYYYDVQERSAFICKDCFDKEKKAHKIGFFSFYKARELGARIVDALKRDTVQNYDVTFPPGVLKKSYFE